MVAEIKVNSGKRNEFIDITQEIARLVKESGVKEGVCVVYCPHTTAGITINEGADPDVQKDLLERFSKMVPKDGSYRHSEGNSDSHIKSSLIGASEIVFIENGKLILGKWQSIYFAEFDGPRQRKAIVKIIKG